MQTKLLATVVQFASTADKAANLNLVESIIRDACKGVPEGSNHLVCLPEVFNFYSYSIESKEERLQAAIQNSEIVEEQSPTISWASSLAQELGIYLVAGSVLEYNPIEPARPFNTTCVFSPVGELVSKYRKINLFKLGADPDTNEDARAIMESSCRTAGGELATFSIGQAKVGLGICFDLRFPHMFEEYRRSGCNIFVLPSAFLHQTGQAHWEILCRARAIENQSYFLAPNQHLQSKCFGHSMIVDPWGEVVAVLDSEQNGYISSELELRYIESVRNTILMN